MLGRRSLLAAPLVALPSWRSDAQPSVTWQPERPVTLSVGFVPGGSTDIAARILADRLGHYLGGRARVLVENRGGASGVTASEWFRRQPADGHALMLVERSSHAVVPAAMRSFNRFDPLNDFTHLAMVGTGPLMLVATPGFGGDTAAALIAHLRGSQAGFTYATSGVGSISHLAVEMLALELGSQFTHVPYRSGAETMRGLYRGDGQFSFAVLAAAAGAVRDGLIRGLAVTSPERFPGFPDIPTMSEVLPGYDLVTWNMIIAPAGLPAFVAATLNKALLATIAEVEVARRLLVNGLVAWRQRNTPDVARAFLAREIATYRGIVARTGVRLEP
jgi:tripartite-type tricarboxylate transporter receptor subunit TctC